MIETLEIFSEDHMLYVKAVDVLYNEPIRVTRWYPIGISEHDYKYIHGDQALGQPVTSLGDGLYRGADGKKYRLLEGGGTRAAFSQPEPVPPPVQRGRKLPLRWQSGRWEKQTSTGWKPA